jgi:hypothetical protein
VIDAFSREKSIEDVTRSYGRVAMAYVQGFGLKAIAPFFVMVLNTRLPETPLAAFFQPEGVQNR